MFPRGGWGSFFNTHVSLRSRNTARAELQSCGVLGPYPQPQRSRDLGQRICTRCQSGPPPPDPAIKKPLPPCQARIEQPPTGANRASSTHARCGLFYRAFWIARGRNAHPGVHSLFAARMGYATHAKTVSRDTAQIDARTRSVCSTATKLGADVQAINVEPARTLRPSRENAEGAISGAMRKIAQSHTSRARPRVR